jgi:phosphate:Na+ symporter
MNTILFPDGVNPRMPAGHSVVPGVEELRWKALQSKDVGAGEKGALIALLGSIERAEGLIERIRAERASVDRSATLRQPAPAPIDRDLGQMPGAAVPARAPSAPADAIAPCPAVSFPLINEG